MLLNLERAFEAATLLVGVISWKHIKPAFLRIIIGILALTCINEIFLIPHINIFSKAVNRDFFYNIFSLIDMSAWLYVFYKITYNKNKQQLFIITGSLCVVYSFIDVIFLSGFNTLHTTSLMAININTILLCFSYLYSSLSKDFYTPLHNPFFWITSACICYHSLLFISFASLSLPRQYWDTPLSLLTWNFVIFFADLIYYLLLSIAFISCKKHISKQARSQQ